MAKVLGTLAPTATIPSGLDAATISRDKAVVDKYVNDPLVHDKVSVRLGIEMLDSGLWALAHAGELTLPLLLVHGSADRLTSPAA